MRFQNGTGTLEVLQKTKNAFPRWARSVVFLCSHPAWERDFCFLQHLCSESARFSPAKMGEPPWNPCSRFKFIYDKRFRPPGGPFRAPGARKTQKTKKIQSGAKILQLKNTEPKRHRPQASIVCSCICSGFSTTSASGSMGLKTCFCCCCCCCCCCLQC